MEGIEVVAGDYFIDGVGKEELLVFPVNEKQADASSLSLSKMFQSSFPRKGVSMRRPPKTPSTSRKWNIPKPYILHACNEQNNGSNKKKIHNHYKSGILLQNTMNQSIEATALISDDELSTNFRDDFSVLSSDLLSFSSRSHRSFTSHYSSRSQRSQRKENRRTLRNFFYKEWKARMKDSFRKIIKMSEEKEIAYDYIHKRTDDYSKPSTLRPEQPVASVVDVPFDESQRVHFDVTLPYRKSLHFSQHPNNCNLSFDEVRGKSPVRPFQKICIDQISTDSTATSSLADSKKVGCSLASSPRRSETMSVSYENEIAQLVFHRRSPSKLQETFNTQTDVRSISMEAQTSPSCSTRYVSRLALPKRSVLGDSSLRAIINTNSPRKCRNDVRRYSNVRAATLPNHKNDRHPYLEQEKHVPWAMRPSHQPNHPNCTTYTVCLSPPDQEKPSSRISSRFAAPHYQSHTNSTPGNFNKNTFIQKLSFPIIIPRRVSIYPHLQIKGKLDDELEDSDGELWETLGSPMDGDSIVPEHRLKWSATHNKSKSSCVAGKKAAAQSCKKGGNLYPERQENDFPFDEIDEAALDDLPNKLYRPSTGIHGSLVPAKSATNNGKRGNCHCVKCSSRSIYTELFP